MRVVQVHPREQSISGRNKSAQIVNKRFDARSNPVCNLDGFHADAHLQHDGVVRDPFEAKNVASRGGSLVCITTWEGLKGDVCCEIHSLGLKFLSELVQLLGSFDYQLCVVFESQSIPDIPSQFGQYWRISVRLGTFALAYSMSRGQGS